MSFSGEDWKKYRDSAPEAVDDESLKRLISKNGSDPVLIAAAIQDLWNDQPEIESTVWTSTSKTKKGLSNIVATRTLHTSIKPHREKGTKSVPSQNTEKVKKSATPFKHEKSALDGKEFKHSTVDSSATAVASDGKMAWNGSKNLAQKLKEQLTSPTNDVQLHSEDILYDREEVILDHDDVEHISIVVESLSQNDTDDILAANISSLDIIDETITNSNQVEVPIIQEAISHQQNLLELHNFAEVNPEPEPVDEKLSDVHSTKYLNLGKWETQAEAADSRGGFQFGTFGSDDSPRSTSWTDVKPTDQNGQQTWTANASASTVDLPSSTASISGPDLSSLFPMQSQKPGVSENVQVNASRYDQKHAIPPGLDVQNQSKNLNNQSVQKSMPASQPTKQDLPQQMQYQNVSQFPQQAAGNMQAGRSSVVPTPNLVPPFYSSFDLASANQYGHPYATSATVTAAAAVAPPNVAGSTPISSPTPGALPLLNQQHQQQQQQQQTFAPPPGMTSAYGYYPYGFPNQAFYYSQPNIPNYYGQNRSVYQNSRSSFQNDPYANSGNMYPDMYPSGQFQDSNSSYGHATMPQATSSVSSNLANNLPNNKQKSGPVAVNQQQMPQADVSSHNSYSYNPYAAARGTNDQSWQFQNSNQGWGGHMMPFPVGNQTNNGSSVSQNPGFVPQQQANQTSQHQQNSRDTAQRTNIPPSVYSGSTFNNRGGGPGASVNAAAGHQW